jgi:hypothetical protein
MVGTRVLDFARESLHETVQMAARRLEPGGATYRTLEVPTVLPPLAVFRVLTVRIGQSQVRELEI